MSILGLVAERPVAKAPVPLSGGRSFNLFGGLSNRSDKTAQLDAMGGVSTLFAIVDQLASSVSQVEWGLFDQGQNNPFAQQPHTQRKFYAPGVHPAATLLARPNPDQSRMEFMELLEKHYDLTGEAWILVGRNGRSNIPIELYAARPDRITVIPGTNRLIAGYLFHTEDGDKIPLTTDDVIRIVNPHPKDPTRGMGAVQTIMAELDSSTYSAEWNRAFFRNSAQPGGIIEVDGYLSDEQFKQLQQRWASDHGGSANAGRVAILENHKYTQNAFSMVDMQFIEMRKLNSDMIKQAFAMPKSQLGEADDVNRANADAQLVTFNRNLVRPRLRRFREAFNTQLLPMFKTIGALKEFEFVDPVSEDKAAEAEAFKLRAEAAQSLVDAGWSPDDVLEISGLPPMEFFARIARVGGESIIINGDNSRTVVWKKDEGTIEDIPAP